MTNRLVLLLGEFEEADRDTASVLHEWAKAGLLGTVAWTSAKPDGMVRPMTTVCDGGRVDTLQLFDLLTSRIWSQVSVVGIRQRPVGSLKNSRFDAELKLLQMVQDAFAAHKELEFQSFTVSIAQEEGLTYEAFSPYWKMHILHEPVVRIDQAVAAQPMWDDHRHLLVLLLALTMSGGFVWQLGALAPNMADQVVGVHRSLRVGRSYLRVVSAGRLTDEVLAGAFPKSGPWSIPTDVPNALAVPPGTAVSDALVKSLVSRGRFDYRTWLDPKREKPKDMNIWAGLKLFVQEFVMALKSIPGTIVENVKTEIEQFTQKATFGDDASVLLRFNPRTDDLNSDNVVEAIKNLQIGNSVDAIGDAEPWNVLQRVALGAVDGGRFPEGMAPPVSGSSRLVYTDPSAIGPAPDDAPFDVTPFEVALLNLGETQNKIGTMAVGDALTLKTHLEAMREELSIKPAEHVTAKSGNAANSVSEAKSAQLSSPKKLGRIKRLRLRLKERRALRKAAKQAKKKPQVVTGVATQPAAPGVAPAANPPTKNSPVSGHASTNSASDAGAPMVSGEFGGVAEDEALRHSPRHPKFDPKEYTPIGVFYQGSRPELLAEYTESNTVCETANASYTSLNGRFAKDKTCDLYGTPFDHGTLYLHEPTKKLIRVGHVSARNLLPSLGDSDLVATRLADLESRFTEWMVKRTTSLLWRVGESIVAGLVLARRDLARCLEILAVRPVFAEESTTTRIKFGKWTRRGVMSVLLVIAATLASVVFTPIPLLLAVLIVTIYFSGFIVRLLLLARDLVRAQFKFRLVMDEYERSYSRARHDVEEIVRLSSVGDQFDDWQVVVRELVHLPFGKEIGFATAKVGVDEVTRPPAMVLGKSRPDEKQRMQLFLQARRQTVHGGWLTEILDILKQDWRSDYENSRVTTPADNILPESDNSPALSIVGKRPLSDEDVYYPRSDFRRRVVAGDLQRSLVMKKAEQIAIDLRQTALGRLLAKVEVAGLGSALSGQSVEGFLSGLSSDTENVVAFPPDLIADEYPNLRIFEPQLVLPHPGSMNAESGQIQVEPGVELTAAAWRVELSGPIDPPEILRGFAGAKPKATQSFSQAAEPPSPV